MYGCRVSLAIGGREGGAKLLENFLGIVISLRFRRYYHGGGGEGSSKFTISLNSSLDFVGLSCQVFWCIAFTAILSRHPYLWDIYRCQ